MQDMSSGETSIIECPVPMIPENSIRISSKVSLISSGTERMLVDFSQSSLLNKAKQQPEKVKMVLEKIGTDGLFSTIDAVRTKLSQPIGLGYSNVGVITEINDKNTDLKVGDRVVSNGPHADVVVVKKNLCVKIPDGVDDQTASFTIIGSIALQGVRLSAPEIGETFVVIGAGLIGLIAIQILIANGCKVVAIDIDNEKLRLAKEFGAITINSNDHIDIEHIINTYTNGRGCDGVIITASSRSNDIIKQSAKISRKRGRIILVGVVGLEIDRSDFYEKELSFQVSCSYGPGRYDQSYEEEGNDYPVGFVRWTEKRNFEAVLDLMNNGSINVQSLITGTYQFEDAVKAYQQLTQDKSTLGILLTYESPFEEKYKNKISLKKFTNHSNEEPIVGFIGAGNYSSRVLIPAFKNAGAQLHTLVTANGVNSVYHGNNMGFLNASTDVDHIFKNSSINTVAIVTKHNTHAEFVIESLKSGKNIWVEKPLAINLDSLNMIKEAYLDAQNNFKNSAPQIAVGFNRRFSPHISKMKSLLINEIEPKNIIITVNAGFIPDDHWTQNKDIGGGRIIGEACHFIDLVRYLIGHEVTSIQARALEKRNVINDSVSITLGFSDGSCGTIMYLSNGSSKYPKERVEVFVDGKVLKLDNFIKLRGYGWKNFKKMNLFRQDKGQHNAVMAFKKSIENGRELIPIEEIFEVAEVTIKVSDLISNQN